MALTKLINFYGFDTNCYVKISGMLIKESGSDEQGKKYDLELQIDSYTNDTKSHHFSQTTKKFSELRINEITIDNGYAKLKETEEFNLFSNC